MWLKFISVVWWLEDSWPYLCIVCTLCMFCLFFFNLQNSVLFLFFVCIHVLDSLFLSHLKYLTLYLQMLSVTLYITLRSETFMAIKCTRIFSGYQPPQCFRDLLCRCLNPSALWHMGLCHGPGLRQLVASLSPSCRSGFNPSPAIYKNCGDWSDTGLAFLWALFFGPVGFHQCSIFIHSSVTDAIWSSQLWHP
jgi:hypothetical protein